MQETIPRGFAAALLSVWAVFRVSLRRLIRTRLLMANVGLAMFPVMIVILSAIFTSKEAFPQINEFHMFYELSLRTAYLHFIIFFVANIFGFAVMRQDLEDKTLHYLLLQPIGRWAIVLGKLGAYLVLSSILCIASLWLVYLIYGLRFFGPAALVADLFAEGRMVILVKESLVLVLGLLIYGAIAMLMGSFFKSGLYAIILLLWEAGVPYLPSVLKNWTATHYLQSLLPDRSVAVPKMFELLGEPASVAMSLTVLLSVSVLMMAIATAIFYFKECNYGNT